jgi:hypothetical protein
MLDAACGDIRGPAATLPNRVEQQEDVRSNSTGSMRTEFLVETG